MSDDELAELERLAAASTPGPWKSLGNWGVGPWGGCNSKAFRRVGRGHPVLFRCQGELDLSWFIGTVEREANCRFVAAARLAVPALVAEVRRLRAELNNKE